MVACGSAAIASRAGRMNEMTQRGHMADVPYESEGARAGLEPSGRLDWPGVFAHARTRRARGSWQDAYLWGWRGW
jgi:hypothetical protein